MQHNSTKLRYIHYEPTDTQTIRLKTQQTTIHVSSNLRNKPSMYTWIQSYACHQRWHKPMPWWQNITFGLAQSLIIDWYWTIFWSIFGSGRLNCKIMLTLSSCIRIFEQQFDKFLISWISLTIVNEATMSIQKFTDSRNCHSTHRTM